MGAEERFLEAIEEDEEVDTGVSGQLERRHQRLGEKNKSTVDRFLGKGQRVHDVVIVPKYYGELLTWALKRYMDKEVSVMPHSLLWGTLLVAVPLAPNESDC